MNDVLMIGMILFAWIALNRWALPAMGIQTCMSGGCCGSSCQTSLEEPIVSETEAKTDSQVVDRVEPH